MLIDNWDNPTQNLPVKEFKLSDKESKVLVVPEGNANGLQTICEDAQILIFSNKTLNESKDDDFRLPADWWYDWNKK